MATPIKSQQELWQLFIDTLQDVNPSLTDITPGSINDSLAGAFSLGAQELQKLILDRFSKTFIETASDTDLETLAVDHFGASFARPAATKAVGTVTFSRATSTAGSVVIPAGTVVKTKPDANGKVQRFATLTDVTIVGLSISASVQAQAAGLAGNVNANTITVLESTLLDSSIVVTNAGATSGGAEKQDDATYRETIRKLIENLRGASLAAIKAAALTVSGVITATAVESLTPVIPYNIATGLPQVGKTWFYIPTVQLYVADINGTASTPLLAQVITKVAATKAAGVKVDTYAATPLTQNWTASLTLNPAGPNYATLQSDTTMIKSAMSNYINGLPIGSSFNRSLARAAIMATWGAGGTGDLTDFQTTLPAGDVSATSAQKLVAGSMATV